MSYTHRDNREQLFEPMFRDKEIVSAKLRELGPIRNAISHVRGISEDEQETGLYCKDIVERLQIPLSHC